MGLGGRVRKPDRCVYMQTDRASSVLRGCLVKGQQLFETIHLLKRDLRVVVVYVKRGKTWL